MKRFLNILCLSSIFYLIVLISNVHGTSLSFDPDRHHLLLIAKSDRRVKRALEDEFTESELTTSSENVIEDETDTPFLNETARISSCHVTTDICYRYARTQVTSSVLNKNPRAASEVIFQMILPEAAFISKFLMEVDGQVFEAYVKEKEEARKVYTDAQNRGFGAGLVEVNARHANVFNVNLNVKASSRVNFNLTYEEFLIRKLGQYEQIIHIRPEQISEIPDYKISVKILESQNITKIQVPQFISNEILTSEGEWNREAEISQPSGNSAIINWKPSAADKNRMASDVGMKFVVRYDIQHDAAVGEILLMNGYFVHFFAPSHILPLRKHVVYVLDTSGSMNGRKMQQMKHVMSTVMDDLKPDDYFNIIQFSTDSKVVMPRQLPHLAEPIMAAEFALRQAHQLLDSLVASGGTNIDGALKDALAITSRVKPSPEKEGIGTLPENVESLILFLTDGDPTVGVTRPEVIIANAQERNVAKVPIYTISFGIEPDFGFLKKLALQNFGFVRKIYEGGDADIQIRGFYKEISSPLLSNITFKYTTNSSQVSVKKLTKQKFTNIFTGSEIVVAGYLHKPLPRGHRNENVSIAEQTQTFLAVDIDANGRNGHVTLSGDDLVRNAYDLLPRTYNQSTASVPTQLEDEFLERLWAYITIKQLLDIHPSDNNNGSDDGNDYVYEDFGEPLAEGSDQLLEEEPMDDGELLPPIPMSYSSPISNETARDRALRLALKFGFVTPITSLVVVKPEDESQNTENRNEIVDLEEAKATTAQKHHHGGTGAVSFFRSSSGASRARSSLMSSLPRGINGPPPAQAAIGVYTPSTFQISPRTLAVPSSADISGKSWLTNFGTRKAMASLQLPHTITQSMTDYDQAQALTFIPKAKFAGSRYQDSGRIHDGKLLTTARPNRLVQLSWPISKDSTGTSFIMAFGTQYVVLTENEPWSHLRNPRKCTGGTRHRRFQGTCQHLKNCIRPEFKQNFQVYADNYFCEIPGIGVQYAGVCCTK